MQIRSRLTLQFLYLVSGILVIALVFIYHLSEKHLENEYYRGLKSKAIMTFEMVKSKVYLSGINTLPSDSLSYVNFSQYSENISIYDLSFQKIFSLIPIRDTLSRSILSSTLKEGEFRFENNLTKSLGLVLQDRIGNKFLVVIDAHFDRSQLQQLAKLLVIVFFLSIAIVFLVGWFFAGQALSPVIRTTTEVNDILPNDLSKRLYAKNDKDEIGRLILTFNDLLNRIENAFNSQKLFLSHVSHELKNPLNIIISQLQAALLKDRSNQEFKATIQSVLSDSRDLDSICDKLLQLAKVSSSQVSFEKTRIRIDELIWQARAQVMRSHPEYEIRIDEIELPLEEKYLYIQGNEQLIKAAFINLIENGCKYSLDKVVNIKLKVEKDGLVHVEFHNMGPSIPKDDFRRVFEPFYRSSNTALVHGSGIGLSLVKSIMKMHNFDLNLISNDQIGTLVQVGFTTGYRT